MSPDTVMPWLGVALISLLLIGIVGLFGVVAFLFIRDVKRGDI